MVGNLAHAHRERSYLCRHENVCATGRFRAALQAAVVHRSHLIGVVGEVCGRAGIVERVHSADEQRTLMMRSCERTAESGARLAIAEMRVGEENAARRAEAVADGARLAHKAVLQLHAVYHRRAVGNYAVLAYHVGADIYAGVRRTDYCAVAEPRRAVYLALVLYYRVCDVRCVHYLHVVADGAAFVA